MIYTPKLYNTMRCKNSILLALMLIALACQEPHRQNGFSEMISASGFGTVVDGPWQSHEYTTTPNLFSDGINLYVSWIKRDSVLSYLYYSRFYQNTWSEPERVAQGEDWFVNWADFPQFSAYNGTLMATFLKKSDSGTYTYDIFYTLKRDDEPWSLPQKLHRDNVKAEHGFVSIAPSQRGFLVSWLDGRYTQVAPDDHNKAPTSDNHQSHGAAAMSIRGITVSYDGTLGPESLIDDRVCDCCQTAIAVDESGGAVVAYRDRSRKEIRDISLKKGSPESGWSDPVSTSDQWGIAGCPVNGPSIDVFGNQLSLAWFTAAQDNPSVHVAFSAMDTLQLTPAIRMDSGAAIGRVDVVQLSEEAAVISWVEPQGEEDFVRAQWVNNRGQKGPLLTLSQTSSSRASGFPRLMRHGDLFYLATTRSAPDGSSKIGLISWPLSVVFPAD